MELSGKKIKEYIKGGGESCPYCGSDGLRGGSWDSDNGYCNQSISCLSCKKDWDDVYTLTGIYEMEG